ncbi:hypothetical protein [Pseudooceanicola algae]|nr:hypothetical protein [Pseudooceanicola algae]
MLLRPFRLILMLGAAFIAGMLYQHERQQQDCLARADLTAGVLCQ